MSRHLRLEQWTAIVVAILVVAGGLGIASAGLTRARSLSDGASAESAASPGQPSAARDPVALGTSLDEGETSGAGATGAGPSPAAGQGAAEGLTSSGAATTTRPATTTTSPPPATTVAYYPGDSGDFCARLSGVRVGAGLPALASCSQMAPLQAIALQFAQAKSVWHTGSTNEIVGITYKDMSGLIGNFAASPQHYGIITAGSSGVTANVGCYYREDPADLGYR